MEIPDVVQQELGDEEIRGGFNLGAKTRLGSYRPDVETAVITFSATRRSAAIRTIRTAHDTEGRRKSCILII